MLGERPIDYVVYEPDPETLVLSFEKAVIDPEAAVRITPEAGGPVSLVTAFAQPETKVSEVRVVVKRAAGLKPEIARRGALLVVDFPRSGAVAASPPILEQAAGAGVTEVGSLPLDSTTAATEVATHGGDASRTCRRRPRARARARPRRLRSSRRPRSRCSRRAA